ncbi:hypothetical protein, partial [Pseudomonas sp. FEN]
GRHCCSQSHCLAAVQTTTTKLSRRLGSRTAQALRPVRQRQRCRARVLRYDSISSLGRTLSSAVARNRCGWPADQGCRAPIHTGCLGRTGAEAKARQTLPALVLLSM